MHRYESPPVHLLALERKLSPKGPTWSYPYTPPGGEGDMKNAKSGISLLFWPAGWTQPWGKPNQFEYHTLHEEIFFLSGTMNFGNVYKIAAPGYLNHPPFWKHVTNFFVEKDNGMVTMLMRSGTQPVVQLENFPQDWDGQCGFAPASRSIGTRNLQLDDLPWLPLRSRGGGETGLEAKRLGEDRDDGWTTWLMRVPAGWQTRGPAVTRPGGDELYVVEGDLVLGPPTRTALRKSGYVCRASTIGDGDGYLSSVGGATFVRWTRGAEGIWHVPPQV